jgi:hypothetical protein
MGRWHDLIPHDAYPALGQQARDRRQTFVDGRVACWPSFPPLFHPVLLDMLKRLTFPFRVTSPIA